MVEFKNKRISVKVHQTIKHGSQFGEFIKWELGEEADIADGTNSREARTQLFKELLEESTIREATVKAIENKGDIDRIIQLLQGLFKVNDQSSVKSDPPIHYYGPNDLIDDEEEMSMAQLKESENV